MSLLVSTERKDFLMDQKGNNIARKITILLSVLSLAISFFAMSPTLTYANGSQYVDFRILRPVSSTVGSVLVTDVTQHFSKCISLPKQEILVPFPGPEEIMSQDVIKIQNFPDGNCRTPVNDLAHRNPMNDFLEDDSLKELMPCDNNVCRVYVTPAQA
jgi:hypothetical protein